MSHYRICNRSIFLAILLSAIVSCASATRAAAPDNSPVEKTVLTLESGGKKIPVDRYGPAGVKSPAVVLLHGADGLQSPAWVKTYQTVAERVAREGYRVYFVHYFERTGSKTGDPAAMAAHFATWAATVLETLEFVRKQPESKDQPVALMGASLGATLAMAVGSEDPKVSCVVELFGGAPDWLIPRLGKMPPTFILHGDADPIVNVEHAYRLQKAFMQNRRAYTIKIYPGQSHGFKGDADADAERSIKIFLDRYLKNINPPSEKLPSPAHNPMLHRAGAKIVDGQNQPVSLKAVNLGGWLVWEGWIFGKGIITAQSTIVRRLESAIGRQQANAFRAAVYDQFINEDDFARISQAGFNCVRVPLHYRQFDADDGWKKVDCILDWCKKYHLYAVLDLHLVPGATIGLTEPDPIWKSDATRQRIVALWSAMAARYHDRPEVAGYDLLNEPQPPSGAALVDLQRQLIHAIRQSDRNHMIVIEGNKCSSDFSIFDGLLDDNQVYSFHIYNWFGDDRAKKIAEYQSLAWRDDAPLWCGEFGQNTYDMMRSTIQMFSQCPEIAGWAYWTWKKAGPTPPAAGSPALRDLSKFPGLMMVRMSNDWIKTMDWLGAMFDAAPPPAAVIKQGAQDFIAAMSAKNCVYDDRMERILLQKGE